MDIADVVRESGLPASTLRYYEERGLIASAGRSGLRRIFGADILQRLQLIALGRAAGFTLDEIGAMLRPDGGADVDRRLLRERADELERTIRALSALRDGLRHAAACKAASHLECPTFRRLLKAAGRGRLAMPTSSSGMASPARPARSVRTRGAKPPRR